MTEDAKLRRGNQPIVSNREGEWNDLAELILEAEIKDEIATGIRQEVENARAKREGDGVIPNAERSEEFILALSLRVGCSVGELEMMKGLISDEVWQVKKLERVVRREQIRTRLGNYEELSYLAVQKLIQRVENGMIKETPELIAVATLGERMIQMANSKTGSSTVQSPDGNPVGGVNIQINNVNGQYPNGDLPGAGDIGFIELNLKSRIIDQMSNSVPVDPNQDEGQGFLARVEMLNAKEIPLLLEHGKEEIKEESND